MKETGKDDFQEQLWDVDAETALIGSVLIDPDAMGRVSGIVSGDDLYLEKHKWVWGALVSLTERNEPVDIITICDELERAGHLDEAGGSAYITHLINAVPSAIHAEGYAQIVARKAFRRGLLQAANVLARLAYETGDDDAVAENIDRTITAILERRRTRRGAATSVSEVVMDVWAQATEYQDNPLVMGQVRGLDTGWPDMNKLLGGWRAGLYVVLAVPHMGKSWFVIHAARNVATAGRRVLLFSLEMGAHQIVERLALAASKSDLYTYERGLGSNELVPFSEELDALARTDMVIDDVSVSLSEIAARARQEHRRKALDMIVVDYLGLIEGVAADNRNLEIGLATRRLHLLARELGVPILAPHQISDKTVDGRRNKRPQLSDGYESGHVGQDADVVLGLYRASRYDEDRADDRTLEVLVLKDRLGGSGRTGIGQRVEMYFSEWGEIRSLAAPLRGQAEWFSEG